MEFKNMNEFKSFEINDKNYPAAIQIAKETEECLKSKRSVIMEEIKQTLDNIYKQINQKKLNGQNYISFATSLRLNQVGYIRDFLLNKGFEVKIKIEGLESKYLEDELEKYITASCYDSRFDYNTAVFNVSWFKEIK